MQILVEKMGIPDKKGLSKLDQQASLNPQYDQRVKLGCYQALSLSLSLYIYIYIHTYIHKGHKRRVGQVEHNAMRTDTDACVRSCSLPIEWNEGKNYRCLAINRY